MALSSRLWTQLSAKGIRSRAVPVLWVPGSGKFEVLQHMSIHARFSALSVGSSFGDFGRNEKAPDGRREGATVPVAPKDFRNSERGCRLGGVLGQESSPPVNDRSLDADDDERARLRMASEI